MTEATVTFSGSGNGTSKVRAPPRVNVKPAVSRGSPSPITTTPWGQASPKLAEGPAPSKEMRASQLLYNEPKYIRMDDGGLHTLEAAGLTMKKGVYY